MAYAIIRAAKIKTIQAGAALHSHVVRKDKDKKGDVITRENVDVSKSKYNEHHQLIGDNIHDGFQKRLTELKITPRKNAVLAIEYMVSASRDFFDESKNNYSSEGYFHEALNFIIGKHGYENVISYTIHKDEMTPHAHILVVPIDKMGKLNCRHFLGGREKLTQLQDDFYAKMKHTSRGIELNRGEKKGRNEPEKYIQRTSPKIASLRHDLQNTGKYINQLKKSCEEALKFLDMERLRIESQKLEKEMIRLSSFENQRIEAERQFKKDRQKNTGLGM